MRLGYPQAVLLVLGVLVVGALGSAAASSSVVFSPYNPEWDGSSTLREDVTASGASVEIAGNVSAYDRLDPGSSVAVVLSPTRPYTAAEAARLRAFVEGGGTLVVAEDVGPHGNAVLDGVGADARFEDAVLRDERRHAAGPPFPVARNVTDHPLTDGTTGLTLNVGTALRPGDATVLVRSSPYAYLDRDGNEALDDAETVTSYPVATVEGVGDGRVVAVGDPSIFVNAMLERDGNRAFARNVFAGAEVVLLDRSHVDAGVPPLVGLLLAVRSSALAQVALGLAGVALVGGWLRYPGLPGAVRARFSGSSSGSDEEPLDSRPDADDLAAAVAARHPEFEEDRLRRAIAGTMHREGEGERDE